MDHFSLAVSELKKCVLDLIEQHNVNIQTVHAALHTSTLNAEIFCRQDILELIEQSKNGN